MVRPQATISGETAAERRVFAIGDADIQALRRFLCFEPGPTPLLAGAYVRDSLVATTDERLYVLIPRSRSTGLATWVGGVLDRPGSGRGCGRPSRHQW